MISYYLNSRYYDPNTGRFISPDTNEVLTVTPLALTDKNLYAYCDNNPIMRIDNGGEFWHLVIGGDAGFIIGGVSAAISGGDLWEVGVSALAGAASGVLAASGVGVVGQVVGSAAISMASNAANQVKDIVNDESNSVEFDVGDMLVDGVVSAILAGRGGNGASHGNVAGINAAWKRLGKKGLADSNARMYFYKTAHNTNKKFVLTSLKESMFLSTIGTAIISVKNLIRGAI